MGIYSLESVVLDRMTYSKRRNSCPPQAFGYANGQDWQSLLAQHALAQHGRNLHNTVWNRHSFISKWMNKYCLQLLGLQNSMLKWLYMINKSCFHVWVCKFCIFKADSLLWTINWLISLFNVTDYNLCLSCLSLNNIRKILQ